MFFARVAKAVADVDPLYDVVVIDCPPQLGFLTLSALCAATSVLITAHPQMLDIASMNQFLAMAADLLAVVKNHETLDREIALVDQLVVFVAHLPVPFGGIARIPAGIPPSLLAVRRPAAQPEEPRHGASRA